MAGASCFGAPKSTFRDRCKGSNFFYFEVQFSWQVQHFAMDLVVIVEDLRFRDRCSES